MTAATSIHELDPQVDSDREFGSAAARPVGRTVLPRQRGQHLRLVPAATPGLRLPSGSAGAGAQRTGAVQLTRRGRLALLVVLLAVGAVLAFALSGVIAGAARRPDTGSAAGPAPTRTVVVQPGQTLWSIAQDVAPRADRRDTIARIVSQGCQRASPSTNRRGRHRGSPSPPPRAAGATRAEISTRTGLDLGSRVGITYPYI